ARRLPGVCDFAVFGSRSCRYHLPWRRIRNQLPLRKHCSNDATILAGRARVIIRKSIGMFLASSCATAIAWPAIAQPGAAAAAQPSSVQSAGDQNAIIITAQKRTQRLIDVPQSVSVISGDSLEKQHAQRLSDYLTRIP